MSLVRGAELPKSNTVQANFPKLINDHQNKQKLLRSEIKMKAENLASEIIGEYLDRKPHRAVQSDFSKFPSNELSRAFKATART
jgi:dynactin 1